MFQHSFLRYFFQHFIRVFRHLRSLHLGLIGLILVCGFAIAAIEEILSFINVHPRLETVAHAAALAHRARGYGA
jgi:hypothetical protein